MRLIAFCQFQSIPFGQFQFHIKLINSKYINSNFKSALQTLFTYYFLQWVGTLSTYLEYLLQVVYIPSRIIMEEIFMNYKIYWQINLWI